MSLKEARNSPAPLSMDSVRGVPDDAAELHHEVMSAQSAGQAPLPNGVGGVREDHHPSTLRPGSRKELHWCSMAAWIEQ